MSDPNIGRVLFNRYELVELLGKGAMGKVYLAKDARVGGVLVAVKFLSQALLNKKMRDRFEREATTCALLGQHSLHIVRVMDYGVTDEIPFYVMEYLQGDSLSDVIREDNIKLERFLSLARQIALGLQCAHEGIQKDGKTVPIVHRDIKPSNILVTQDSSFGEMVKILDFGIAKLLQEETAGQTNCFMGTLAYSSPEQMEGKELTSSSDLYSLGVMMFQMLTGHMPLTAETHTFGAWYKTHHFQTPRSFESVAPYLKLPSELKSLVFRCLAKKPKERPQSAREIVQTLEQLEKDHKNLHSSPKPTENGKQPSSTSPPAQKTPSTPVDPSPAVKPTSSTQVSPNRSLGKDTGKLQVIETTPAIDMICWEQTWPKGKPLAQIVFPQVLQTQTEQSVVTLWAMLKKKEIEQRQISRLYNKTYKNFLYSVSPHPMILWLTVLYDPKQGPRWLRYYMDLKSNKGKRLANLLAHTGRYCLLFFALEEPGRCADVINIDVNYSQRQRLQDWASASDSLAGGQPTRSKELLQKEFEKLQPQIMMKLEAGVPDSSF
ncbi:serine/threonine-protein kinase [Roseofilum sp. BLCC_M154]|uniref:non-specific serine/threonine protein kinase n=1 Tax=Roseofilum acuticapitatum BLCC-M154 TaxID=3022444 RepID=A0ABT7AQG2_9CYAN|nr:serine/threonine-protein kinase [Roseofilum acuticapitatum]MDJ1168802.1 serine/threonine-protein kinase [Roseofilum acuticapitatum BLCC-M154]